MQFGAPFHPQVHIAFQFDAARKPFPFGHNDSAPSLPGNAVDGFLYGLVASYPVWLRFSICSASGRETKGARLGHVERRFHRFDGLGQLCAGLHGDYCHGCDGKQACGF